VNTADDVNADDHSRVKLERASLDYINASLVVAAEADRSYILTQVTRALFIACRVLLCAPVMHPALVVLNHFIAFRFIK